MNNLFPKLIVLVLLSMVFLYWVVIPLFTLRGSTLTLVSRSHVGWNIYLLAFSYLGWLSCILTLLGSDPSVSFFGVASEDFL